MNIQIFGTKKCNDTKKAERFFKERGIKFQFIDMKEKGMNICHMCLSVEGKHVMFAKREEINVFHNHHLTVFFLKLG